MPEEQKTLGILQCQDVKMMYEHISRCGVLFWLFQCFDAAFDVETRRPTHEAIRVLHYNVSSAHGEVTDLYSLLEVILIRSNCDRNVIRQLVAMISRKTRPHSASFFFYDL